MYLIEFLVLIFVECSVLISAIPINEITKIHCNFTEHRTLGYTCQVKNLETYRIEIEGVIGDHLQGKTNEDVKFFDATSKSLQFLPRFLHHTFPNLEHITFNGENFKEILRSDLTPFGKNLRSLSLVNTELEDLPEDLFEDTPNLGHLYLQSANLKHIHKSTFKAVKKLYFLSVNFPCYKGEKTEPSNLENVYINLDIRCHTRNFEHQNLNRRQIECEYQGCGSDKPPKQEEDKTTTEKPIEKSTEKPEDDRQNIIDDIPEVKLELAKGNGGRVETSLTMIIGFIAIAFM